MREHHRPVPEDAGPLVAGMPAPGSPIRGLTRGRKRDCRKSLQASSVSPDAHAAGENRSEL